MPTLYIKDEYYKKMIRLGKEPKIFVNEAVKEKLELEEKKEASGKWESAFDDSKGITNGEQAHGDEV